jgi:hypothetical protein
MQKANRTSPILALPSLEFRLGGGYARIGSVRSLRSSSIRYSRQLSLPGCIGKQIQINDLTELISDALPFGRLWYTKPDDAVDYAKFFSRSHDAVIRVYDQENVIETHEHKGDFQRAMSVEHQ